MLKCPQCQQVGSLRTGCERCGFRPAEIDGFTAWAPQLAHAGAGYDPGHFERLFGFEEENFWFRARNALIVWALGHYFPETRSLLEIGCGTGFVIAGVQRAFPALRLTGAEAFTAGLAFARSRVHGRLEQMDARAIPYVAEFDVVAAFDVLEHIAEDEQVLRSMHQATRPGGGLLITVPQHGRLWSQFDVSAGHFRRYRAGDLEAKVRAAGFDVVRSTSFVSLLLPAMMLSRRRPQRGRDYDIYAEFRIGRGLNRVLESVLGLERGLIRAGVSFPAGGSRLVVAKKRVA